tara:strand:+ start:2639 stop:3724 length:1086 start_codon:yes stop_codon:yes gene_type:complete
MANKKISQLNAVDPAIGIGSVALFPICSGTGPGDYQSAKITALEIAKFVLDPIPIGPSASDIPSIGFTGTSNIYFDKSNWVDASQQEVESFPFVQVRKSDGLLVTGSGVAFDSATVPWNYNAAENIDMQNNSIINIASLFFNQSASTVLDEDGTNLVAQAAQDLTLSGIRHVYISGQALDLASTPISGNVTITGGDLEIDPGNKLIVNEINTYTMAHTDDPAVLSISGSARFFTWEADAPVGGSGNIDWKDSNVQFDSTNAVINYYFKNVRDGQTLTMYVQNTHATNSFTPTFTNESEWLNGMGGNDYYSPPVPVLWSFPTGDTVAAMKEPPTLTAGTTNVYTFVNIKTGVFASAITGYVY